MDVFLAICWTIVFLCNILCWGMGSEPTWVLVFSPLIVVVFNAWSRYFNNSVRR